MIELELRHIRYFLTVAELRSFTRASERLNVTQPTLSHQVKQLESLIGSALFDRLGHNVALTQAGRLFVPYCQRTLKELEAGRNACAELRGMMRGELQMGVFLSFSNSILPPILSEFAEKYPGVRVVTRVVPRSMIQNALLGGTLDLAIAYISDDCDQIISEKLFEDELVVVVGARHPKAHVPSLTMNELRSMPLVMLTKEFGARQFIEDYFATSRRNPKVKVEMDMIEPILSMLRNSNLATVLSSGAVVDRKGLKAIRLTDPVPRRSVGILWRRQGARSAAALKMSEMIKDAYLASESRRIGREGTR